MGALNSVQTIRGNRLACLLKDELGQGMVEYVLIISLIALAVIAFLPPVADAIVRFIGQITAAFKV
jgi:Flp pilus assembly pilin Flp